MAVQSIISVDGAPRIPPDDRHGSGEDVAMLYPTVRADDSKFNVDARMLKFMIHYA
jgi:hypothetical protein